MRTKKRLHVAHRVEMKRVKSLKVVLSVRELVYVKNVQLVCWVCLGLSYRVIRNGVLTTLNWRLMLCSLHLD